MKTKYAFSKTGQSARIREEMSTPQKMICVGGIVAILFVIVFPPWQQAYRSLDIPYRKNIGHAFILEPPAPVEVRSLGTVDPPSRFYVMLNKTGLLAECTEIGFVVLGLFIAFGRLRAESSKNAKAGRRRFAPHIAIAALLFGFITEGIVLAIMLSAFSRRPNSPAWAEWAFTWTQQPGEYLATVLVRLLRPGFEAQVGYGLVFLFLFQGTMYAVIAYAMLATGWKKKAILRD